MRVARTVAAALTAAALALPGVATAAPADTFTSPTEAWDALQEAKRAVRVADHAVEQADVKVEAARDAVTDAQTDVTAAETFRDAATGTKQQRDSDVAVLAHQMYLSGGVGMGEGWELFALPAGIDMTDVVNTQAYLHSSSNYLLEQARQAAATLLDADAEVTAKQLALQAAQTNLTDSENEAAQARKDAVRARTAVLETRQQVDDYLETLPTTPVASDCTNPNSDAIAATIYTQAQGLGLGDVAALIGIGVGLGETGLQNDTDGDCWYGSCSNGHTSSRGVFQQFYSWTPDGLAWSGQKAPTGGVGVPFDQFNATNAWGPDGWARLDPRMNPAQAANMFFLGPDYGSTMGLEDNAMFQALRDLDVLDITSEQLVTVAQQVQQFPVQHMGSYEANMTRAIDYYLRIKSGSIATPAYQPPLKGMWRNATTNTTRTALNSQTPTQYSDDTAAATIPNDGLLLLGDSLAEGIATIGGAPDILYGGAVLKKTKIGIGTEAAVTTWQRDITTGPHRIVVSLGSNDSPSSSSQYATQIDRLMEAAGPNRHVYWYSLHYSPVDALNAVLTTKARQYDNLTIIETRTFLTPTSGYLSPTDKYLHPNSDGYQQMWTAALNTERQSTGFCPAWTAG